MGDVWAQLSLGDEPAGLLYARNKAYVERSEALAAGDEIAVIPPVSGGDFRLSADPLSGDAAVAEVRDDGAGAIATFIGTTRAHSRGRESSIWSTRRTRAWPSRSWRSSRLGSRIDTS